MVVTCEQCQARFRLADEKLKPEGTKVRCSKCKSVFTVFPADAPPDEVPVSHGGVVMEQPGGEEAAAAPLPASAPVAEDTAALPSDSGAAVPVSGGMDLDFGALEQSMGPGSGDELAEEFSFADTSTEAPAEEAAPPDAAAGSLTPGSGQGPGELDFDATFAESEEPPAVAAPTEGPAEFAFDQEQARNEAIEIAAEGAAFDFSAEPDTTAPGAFDFAAEPDTSTPGEFDFSAETEPAPANQPGLASAPAEFDFSTPEPASALSEFGFETEAAGEPPAFDTPSAPAAEMPGFELGAGDSFESSATAAEPAFGESAASPWEQPAADTGATFDFDEPNFETKNEERVSKGRDEAGLSFGEIDFSDDDGDAPPSFGNEPDFSQAAMAPPPVPEPLPVPPPPPSPRPEARPPRAAEHMPPPRPAKRSLPPMLVPAAVLLLLCGAGWYFYTMGNGRQLIDSLLLKVKGEAPPAPFEQLIALEVAGSSYVKNREAGQLLVVQGTVTNNFPTTRSAISVKGIVLDATGKALQQQTVFCGNYLEEERLRSMKFAQIEEAMNNQFGDSLANINVSPGKVLRFTIVFRNVPKEMANINVEVVDSKPGGS